MSLIFLFIYKTIKKTDNLSLQLQIFIFNYVGNYIILYKKSYL